MNKAQSALFFDRLAAKIPVPKGELSYRNPYTLLVAVVLSAQATDAGVNRATGPLFEVADTPAKMVKLGEARLRDYIRTIGLFNTKAKNVIALSRILIEQYGGEVPLEREKLQALPGVGRKTASVVLNELRVEPAIAVDTHVFRVSQRLGLAKSDDPDEIHAQLVVVLPKKEWTLATHLLTTHGRRTCSARAPLCPGCPVKALCPWPDKTRVPTAKR